MWPSAAANRLTVSDLYLGTRHPQFVCSFALLCGRCGGLRVVPELSAEASSTVHKRLMTLACLAFIGPAVSRINQLQLFELSTSALLVGAVVVLVSYDVFTRRRPHSATLLAGGADDWRLHRE